MNVIWSTFAEASYEQNINYLLEERTVSEVLSFTSTVAKYIELIKINPKLFPDREGKGFRSAVIVPAIMMYYKINDDHIELHWFWNNHMDKRNLKL